MQPGLLPSVIAVGVDGSPESSRALSWALALAEAVGSRLVVVHSTGLLEGAGLQPAVDLEVEVRKALGLIGGGRTPGPAGETRPERVPVELVRRPGHPVDVLLGVAAEQGADLLVVGHRGVGLKPAGLGSTSEGVLQAASMPVVVFPPGE